MNRTSTKSRTMSWSLVLVASAIAGLAVISCTELRPSLGHVNPEHFSPTAFDWAVRSRPDMGSDPRLLVVTITEEDIKFEGRWPLSDRILAQVLAELQRYQPRVIGLDLYRDLPVEPGHEELVLALKKPNVIAITRLGDRDGLEVPPPEGVPKERVGFNNILTDPDGVVRRNLIFAASTSTEKSSYSFSVRLALSYLEAFHISPQISNTNPKHLQLGKVVFVPLKAYSVSNQTIDAKGYQIPLYYRSAENVARQVTLADVLKGRVEKSWVKDRVVLVGTTATTLQDSVDHKLSFKG